MPGTASPSPIDDLRQHLRSATMAVHDLLDQTMQAASGWRNLGDYARFLSVQHAARAPVEVWLAAHAPADLRPPEQTPLIAQDLAELGLSLPAPAADFGLRTGGEGQALGAAWVLAGSALGNKSILKQMRRASAQDERAWPAAFLGDEAMLNFWHGLRARLEQPTLPSRRHAATDAAQAVFAHFLAYAGQPCRESAL